MLRCLGILLLNLFQLFSSWNENIPISTQMFYFQIAYLFEKETQGENREKKREKINVTHNCTLEDETYGH